MSVYLSISTLTNYASPTSDLNLLDREISMCCLPFIYIIDFRKISLCHLDPESLPSQRQHSTLLPAEWASVFPV